MAVQFFVPLAVAGAKIFFKFASKRAAQTFKSNYAKAGKITTKTPPKNATVTTTGSQKGKSVLKDLKSPVTAPSVRARNPNTTTLPKKPADGGTGKKLTGAAAIGAGVVAGSTATSKDADKKKKRKPTGTYDRSTVATTKPKSKTKKKNNANVTARQIELAKRSAAQGGGSVLSRRKPDKKDSVSKPTPPPARPKKSKKAAKPASKPQMYTAIDTKTGKPKKNAPKVTAAERLKQEDAYKQFVTLQADIIKSKLSEAAKKQKNKKKNMSNGGAALKAVPAGNKGLKKLPTAVRNRMGFMRKGGVAKRK